MEREAIDQYCKWEELNHTLLEGLSLQELFDLKFEILRLRDEILKRLDRMDGEK